jgi:hypothetical protein
MSAAGETDHAGPETGFYVYGVVRAGAGRVPPELVGIDQAPVRTVDHDGIAAVVAEIGVDRPPGRRADLMAHSAVLDSLVATGVVIPVQFGSVLADAESVVEDLLVPGRDYFESLLDELSGHVQFNLRASYHEPVMLAEVVAENPEIADLRERTRDLPPDGAYGEKVRLGELVARAVEGKRAIDAESLLDSVEPLVAACVVRPGGATDHVADLALLVAEDRRADFEEQLELLAEQVHERIRLRLVGPVAPYDFVGDA